MTLIMSRYTLELNPCKTSISLFTLCNRKMASELVQVSAHEAPNQTEVSLREAFKLLQSQLKPPFSLTVPSPKEYVQLNQAILFGILTQPELAKTHIKYLHAIVSDGYSFFTNLVTQLVYELYPKIVPSAKVQLIWVTSQMVNVLAIGIDNLLVCLLRRIVGDLSDGNLWLCSELLNLLLSNWDWVLEESLVLTSALYTYLRLLADHYKISSLGLKKFEELKCMEVDFCIKMLREKFDVCLKIGRDLVRLLQDLVHIPEFRAIWKDLLLNPVIFKTPHFSDISHLYKLKTSSRYFLLRVNPEMETKLRFLLTHVKLGNQRRYQIWFARDFLCGNEKNSIVIDIVRFICCAHHPPNEIIQSDIIQRWAVIGWLLKCCMKNHLEANVKLALFYDWLFFDENVDNIMNIEPAILLMVNSIPKYVDMTHTLLEFLLLLLDNYDLDRKRIIYQGISSAFSIIVNKGVVHSLDALILSDAISPVLRERLSKFIIGVKVGISKELQPMSMVGLEKCNQKENFESTSNNDSIMIQLENLVHDLGETIRQSYKMGLNNLEKILVLYGNTDAQKLGSLASLSPFVLSHMISKEFESNGYKIFPTTNFIPASPSHGDQIQSATAFILRAFILLQSEKMEEIISFWSGKGFPVGPHLLSYASRLDYEASLAGFLGKSMVNNNPGKLSNMELPLLKFHIDGYNSFRSGELLDSSISSMSGELVCKLIHRAFSTYKYFLTLINIPSAINASPAKLLISDLLCLSETENDGLKFLFRSVFFHLSDLSICEEDIIKLLLHRVRHADLVELQFDLGLKKYSIFGQNTESIVNLIKNSLNWDFTEQHRLWGLMRSEFSVSDVQPEKIILGFFCSAQLDRNMDSIAVEGLLTLCSCRVPTPELVGTIISMPSNMFEYFSAAVLATWAISNATALFDSLANYLEILDNENGYLDGIVINKSAIIWLANYFNDRGIKGVDILRNFSMS